MATFETLDGKLLQRKVRAIISDNSNEILMIQPLGYKASSWTFVGGGIESGETPEEAIAREIREELGVTDFKIIHHASKRYTYIFSEDYRKQKGYSHYGQVADVYIVLLDKKNQIKKEPKEIQKCEWVSLLSLSRIVPDISQSNMVHEVMNEYRTLSMKGD